MPKSLYLNRGQRGCPSFDSWDVLGIGVPAASSDTRSTAVSVYQLLNVTEYWLAPLHTRVTSVCTISPSTPSGSGTPLVGWLDSAPRLLICTPGAKNVVTTRLGVLGWNMRLSLLPTEPVKLLAQDLQHQGPQPLDLAPVAAACHRRARGRRRIRRADVDFSVHLADLHWHGQIPPGLPWLTPQESAVSAR
jgi:hypothetical protein